MMATVYDLAVRKLVEQALELAKTNPGLRVLELEAFKRAMWPPDGETFRRFGLPVEVLERAIKEAHRQMRALTDGEDTGTAGGVK
jgi:hypothetical protein